MPQSIVECIREHATAQPDAFCLGDAKQSYTYRQAWNAVVAFAVRLRALNVRPGDRVVVECSQDACYCVAEHAVHLAGAIFVPVERHVSAERFVEIAGESEARAFVGVKPRENAAPFLSLTEISPDAPATENPFPMPDGDACADLLYSTGTTGKSKGIRISHASNVAIAENIADGVQMRAGGVEIIPISLCHSHGLRTTYANLRMGNGVAIAEGVSFLKPFFALIERYHATAIDLVPSALRMILKLASKELAALAPTIDYVELGSAPLTESDKHALSALLPSSRLYNFYGSTESGRTCAFEFSRYPDMPCCIGRATRNAEILVVDAERRPIVSSAENTGFLAFRGGMNMLGYWKNDELTASVLRDGVLYTNDVGYTDADGLTFMLGREDDVINYCGVKISPDEIETIVLRCEGVADCACVGQSDPLYGQSPKLYVKLSPGAALTERQLAAYCSANIDRDKQPKRVVLIDEIPRTYNGKLLRRVLKERAD